MQLESNGGMGVARDDEWCDLIARRADEHRRGRGQPDLDLLLDEVPMESRTAAVIDAAIREVLRTAAGGEAGAVERRQRAEELIARRPQLAEAVRLSLTLDEVITSGSSGGGLESVAFSGESWQPAALPAEFGPVWSKHEQRYLLLERLTGGKSAATFKGVDRARSGPDRCHSVVVKMLSEVDGAELQAEAARVARVRHPLVAPVVDAGAFEDRFYIASEFVEGRPLAEQGVIGSKRAAEIACDIAEGLLAAHMAGVTHLDVHPRNIIMTFEGRAVILDFGLGAASLEPAASRRRAAPGFAAPELWRGTAENPRRCDVYSCAGVLCWMLTGQGPNGASVEAALGFLQWNEARKLPTRPQGVPKSLWAVVERGLEIDPQRRHESMAELLSDLRRWLAHEPITWQRPSAGARAVLAIRRTPAWALVGGVFAVLLVLSLLVGVILSQRATLQTAMAAKKVADEQIRLMGALGGMIRGAIKNDKRGGAEWIALLTAMRDMPGPLGLDLDALQLLTARRIELLDTVPTLSEDRGANGKGLESAILRAARGSWRLESGDYDAAVKDLESARERLAQLVKAGDPLHEVVEARMQAARLLAAQGAGSVVSKGDAEASARWLRQHSGTLDSIAGGVRDRVNALLY